MWFLIGTAIVLALTIAGALYIRWAAGVLSNNDGWEQ